MKTLLRPATGLLVLLSLAPAVFAVPVITSTKDDATAAATRKVAGDNIDYTIQISNTGADPATGVTLTDPTPTNTTLVPGSVNVSPLAFDDAYVAVGNTTLRAGTPAATAGPATSSTVKVTDNDTEFLSDDFTISTFQGTSAQGGTVVMVTTGANAGSFSYLPPAGFEGVDTFTYTITDDGSTGFPALTSVGTVTITVSEVVWYVDDSAAGGGTGRSNAPLQNLSTLNVTATDPDEADDYIFLYSGNYSGVAFALEAGQRLIGEPAGLTVNALTIAAGGTRPEFSHNAGTLLTLSTNNTVRSINFTNTNGGGISGSPVGTLTLSDFDVTTTNGTALNLITSGTVTATGADNDLTSTNGTALNVVSVTIGAGNLNFKSISSSGGSANGIILDSTGSSGGLRVTGLDGADAGTDPDPGSGGTIANKTGADGTTVGNGIYLNNTSDVRLAGMALNTFTNSAIRGLGVNGFKFEDSVISGTVGDNSAVTEGAIAFGTITPAANGLIGNSLIDQVNVSGSIEHHLEFYNQSGTMNLTISNSNIHDNTVGSGSDGIQMEFNGTAQAFVNISANTLTNNKSQAIQISTLGDSVAHATIRANIIPRGTQGNEGIVLSNGANSDLITLIGGPNAGDGNTISGFGGVGIFVGQVPGNATTTSLLNASIIGNNVTSPTTATNHSIIAFMTSTVGQIAPARLLIHNNTVTQNSTVGTARGILVDTPDTSTSPEFHATVTKNSVSIGDNIAGVGGLVVQARQSSKGHFRVGKELAGDTDANVVSYPNGNPGVSGIRVRQQLPASGTASTAELEPGTSGGTAATALAANNPAPTTTEVLGTVTLAANNSVVQLPATPTLPAVPLLFAPGPQDPVTAAVKAAEVGGVTDMEKGKSRVPGKATTEQLFSSDNSLLQLTDIDPLLSAAIARWEASGLTGEQLNRMQRMTFTVEEMPGLYLGKAEGDHITLDANAAGNRWFIDRTPGEDSEFSGNGTRLAATANGGAAGRVDALTTIVHELGHAVGLEDSYLEADRDSIMYGFLHLSERRLPQSGQAEGVKVHDHYGKPHTHYLSSVITIGTLPPGKTVTIVQRVTVNAGITAPSVSNQGTVSGTNFSNVLTDDPNASGAANATVTVIEVPPVVSNIARTTAEDTVLNFTAANFTGAYTDANLDPLATVRITSLPANGTLKLVAANVTLNQDIPAASLANLNYTPAGDYNGTDSFNWNASDGTLLAVAGATVNLTITEVNDPVTAGLDPQPAIAEDAAPLVIAAATLAANDIKGPANESTQTLTVISVGTPVGGTVVLNAGSVTFTPTPDFNGAASFQYTVQDNGTTNGVNDFKTAIGQANFTITEVNDAPVAVDDALATVAEDAVPVVVAAATLAANDTKGAANESAQTLTVIAVGNPIGGTVALNAGNVTFTLTPNYNGPASFEYTVQDNGTTSGAANPKTDIGLVSFTITSVNDNPVAAGDTIQRYPTQTVKVSKAALLANDTDPDGGTPAFVSVAAASANGGTVTSDATTIYYTPAANFTAADNFTYTINDGQGGTANGTVTVAIITDNAEGMSVAKMETLGDGSKRVTFGGIPGRSYRVQTTENLTVWTTRLTITADAQGRFQFTDPPPLPPTRFYRSVQP